MALLHAHCLSELCINEGFEIPNVQTNQWVKYHKLLGEFESDEFINSLMGS